MSTSAITPNSPSQEFQQYYVARQTDLRQLGQALESGDINTAQADYNNITSLAQNGPFPNGEPFYFQQRDQYFSEVGQALQAGNTQAAQQAFAQLANTFQQPFHQADPPSAGGRSSAAATPSGSEIVLNVGLDSTSGQPINITINPASSGGEQVTVSEGSQGSSAQQVTFNLAANSSEQIVLNLLGTSAAESGSSPNSSNSSGISVSA